MDNTITPEPVTAEAEQFKDQPRTQAISQAGNTVPPHSKASTDAHEDTASSPDSHALPKETSATLNVSTELSGTPDAPPVEDDKQARKRMAILKSVQDQYRVANSRYYFKDQLGSKNALAFTDKGNRLATGLNTERVSISMVSLAESKGWSQIRVSGHTDFKRQVWREATERGMTVHGFTPTVKDLESLSSQKKAPQRHQPDATSHIRTHSASDNASESSQVINGILVAEGAASYRHREGGSPSYYVTLDTVNGLKTIWGVDLMRAMKASDAIRGDAVSVVNNGRKPVTVRQQIRDEQGRVTGSEELQAFQNVWKIEMKQRSHVMQSVVEAFIDSTQLNQTEKGFIIDAVKEKLERFKGQIPVVPMYDNTSSGLATPLPQHSPAKNPELKR